MSERRSQHLANRVQLVTETVDDEICLSKEEVSLHKNVFGYFDIRFDFS